ncbi:hypothetical protein AGLY_000963 [Aphis glycines]|uniref:Transmembrane protein n=1 Tax=Aphis glycines TaxID=307491 RepID=A0A6G0U9I5_APHGL|nr:hypothetical protein AGLY_000963 [Aphis glycines]
MQPQLSQLTSKYKTIIFYSTPPQLSIQSQYITVFQKIFLTFYSTQTYDVVTDEFLTAAQFQIIKCKMRFIARIPINTTLIIVETRIHQQTNTSKDFKFIGLRTNVKIYYVKHIILILYFIIVFSHCSINLIALFISAALHNTKQLSTTIGLTIGKDTKRSDILLLYICFSALSISGSTYSFGQQSSVFKRYIRPSMFNIFGRKTSITSHGLTM